MPVSAFPTVAQSQMPAGGDRSGREVWGSLKTVVGGEFWKHLEK